MNTATIHCQQLLDLVWQNIRDKDIRQAIDNSNLLVKSFPDFASGWHVTSHVAQLIKRPGPALEAIERALKLQPQNIDWQLHRIGCLLMSGDNRSAVEFANSLLTAKQQLSDSQLDQLAFLCTRMELFEDAAGIYSELVKRHPDNGGDLYNLASIQRFQGKTAEAETSLDKAISLNRQDYESYELRSSLRKQTTDFNHVDELEALLEEGIGLPSGEVRICYALAKELEDMGESKRSFSFLAKGAKLRRKHINYDIEGDLETIDAIIDVFDVTTMSTARQGFSSSEPIFVVGLPRTGTTLVERILGSHPQVFAAGELNHFANQMMALVRQKVAGVNITRRQLVGESANIDFQRLGKAYIENSRPLTGQTPRFVDKMPLNFLYAGLIRKALPQARIIHVKRHPMDSCYAIYKCLFEDAYPWSYDLEEIASYYAAYDRLMQHWISVAPDSIHTVSYEDLVLDQEGQTRQMLAYCGLDWDSHCLRFHENNSASTTASASQIRAPIYNSSIGRWKSYQSELSSLSKQLQNLGVAVD